MVACFYLRDLRYLNPRLLLHVLIDKSIDYPLPIEDPWWAED